MRALAAFESFQGNDDFGEGKQFGNLGDEAQIEAPKPESRNFINLL
jgi:hypothetical protein